MKNLQISVVIRTKNEGKTIEKLFKKLRQQTMHNFEVIVVDNHSLDDTLEKAREYGVDKIISILPDEKFSHPHSTNIGIEAAQAPLVVLTNGHCEPISSTWFADGIKNFVDGDVAGIDGHYSIGESGTDWQQGEDKKWEEAKKKRLTNAHVSTTNAMIRKDLWESYKFDESLPEYEDYDWSQEMRARGYKIIKDPKFNVIHHHPLTKQQWEERVKRWDKLCKMIDARTRPYKQN